MLDNEAAYGSVVSALEKLLARAKDQKSTSLKSCIVALYTADDQNPLRFTGKIGMLQIDFDRDYKLHFFRFYDIDSLQMLFEVELFYGFADNFRKYIKDTLYIFDLLSSGIVGFEFRTKDQADIFCLKVNSSAPKFDAFRELMKQRAKKQIEAKKQSSFFGKLKKKINKLVNEEEIKEEESVVIDVKKAESIQIDSNMQLPEQLPLTWSQLLQLAGVKQSDRKDKDIMRLVIEETIVHQAKKQAQENPDLDQKHFNLIKNEQEESRKTFLPNIPQFDLPPPPLSIPGLELPLPSLPAEHQSRGSTHNRVDLMTEIRNNNLKLKPVKVNEKGMELDLSSMNKEERNDLADHIRLKLQLRKQALNRRKASDSEDD